MKERVIIVTGGFGALGRVVSAAFGERGDKVVRVDFAARAPDHNASGIDFVGVDLTDPVAASKVIADVQEHFGSVDALVNIAGGFVWETLEQGDPATWLKMYVMNVMTAVTMTRAALPALRRAPLGNIINIGALSATRAAAGMGSYGAAKEAVHWLTESLAVEVDGGAVTVNAVLPSIIDTPANRADMPDADRSTWVSPQAVADVILFLASPAARAINGALIPVSRAG